MSRICTVPVFYHTVCDKILYSTSLLYKQELMSLLFLLDYSSIKQLLKGFHLPCLYYLLYYVVICFWTSTIVEFNLSKCKYKVNKFLIFIYLLIKLLYYIYIYCPLHLPKDLLLLSFSKFQSLKRGKRNYFKI